MDSLFGPYFSTRIISKISKLNELLTIFEAVVAAPKIQEAEQLMEYQHPGSRVERDYYNDRIFPLETIEIQGFRTRHDENVEDAAVHIGPYANEFARSMHALAVTVGTDIYFRNGAYRPGAEEGRQVLAHELTHIAQYENGVLNNNTDIKELEKCAESSEAKEKYDPDVEMTIRLNGNYYTFPRSKMRRYAERVAAKLEKRLYEQKFRLGGEEYLRLLCSYSDWQNGR